MLLITDEGNRPSEDRACPSLGRSPEPAAESGPGCTGGSALQMRAGCWLGGFHWCGEAVRSQASSAGTSLHWLACHDPLRAAEVRPATLQECPARPPPWRCGHCARLRWAQAVGNQDTKEDLRPLSALLLPPPAPRPSVPTHPVYCLVPLSPGESARTLHSLSRASPLCLGLAVSTPALLAARSSVLPAACMPCADGACGKGPREVGGWWLPGPGRSTSLGLCH